MLNSHKPPAKGQQYAGRYTGADGANRAGAVPNDTLYTTNLKASLTEGFFLHPTVPHFPTPFTFPSSQSFFSGKVGIFV